MASIRDIFKYALIQNSRIVRGEYFVEEVRCENAGSCRISEQCLWSAWFLFFTCRDYPWQFWRLHLGPKIENLREFKVTWKKKGTWAGLLFGFSISISCPILLPISECWRHLHPGFDTHFSWFQNNYPFWSLAFSSIICLLSRFTLFSI